MALWQHKRPQGTDEMHEEEVVPVFRQLKERWQMVCKTCGKPIIRVRKNEGPEALKALFRF